MNPDTPPQLLLIVLAGPNGAGKSTFYEEYLAPGGLPFVNADLLARGLGGVDDEARARQAADLAEQERQFLLSPTWLDEVRLMSRRTATTRLL